METIRLYQQIIDRVKLTFKQKPRKLPKYIAFDRTSGSRFLELMGTISKTGDLTELGVIEYFLNLNKIDPNRVFYSSVRIHITDGLGNRAWKKEFFEIDLLEYDKVTKKYTIIHSAKNMSAKGAKTMDLNSIKAYLNCPDEGKAVEAFVLEYNKQGITSTKVLGGLRKAEIKMTNMITNEQKTISPSQFKKQLHPKEFYESTWNKITPEDMGTTREDLIKGLDETIQNNLNEL